MDLEHHVTRRMSRVTRHTLHSSQVSSHKRQRYTSHVVLQAEASSPRRHRLHARSRRQTGKLAGDADAASAADAAAAAAAADKCIAGERGVAVRQSWSEHAGRVPRRPNHAHHEEQGRSHDRMVRALHSSALSVFNLNRQLPQQPMSCRCDVFEPWPKTPATSDDSAGLAASAAAIHKVRANTCALRVPCHALRTTGDRQPGGCRRACPSHHCRRVLAGRSSGAAVHVLLPGQVIASSPLPSSHQLLKTPFQMPQNCNHHPRQNNNRHAPANSSARLAGCVSLSGWLPDRDKFSSVLHPSNKNTPVLWCHGSKVRLQAARKRKGPLLIARIRMPSSPSIVRRWAPRRSSLRVCPPL